MRYSKPGSKSSPIQSCSNENTQIKIFNCFWDLAIDLFVEHSNNYAVQHNKPANITKDEITNFLNFLAVNMCQFQSTESTGTIVRTPITICQQTSKQR